MRRRNVQNPVFCGDTEPFMDFEATRHYLRGRFYENFKRFDEAEQAYRIVLKFEPQSLKAINALGYLMARRERYAEAVEFLERAARINPDDANVQFDLGFVREKLKCFEPALESFERAVKLKPKLDRAWYGLGMCRAALGRHADAVDAFQQAAELQPMNPHAWYALGMAHHHNHNPDKVKEVVMHLFRFDPIMTRQLIRDAERADLAHLVKDLMV
jgi:tetratricopeptide (TPR) repeat protein